MGFYEYEIRAENSWKFITDDPKEIAEGINALNAVRDLKDPIPLGNSKLVDKAEIHFVFPCSTTNFAQCEIVPGVFCLY